MSRRSGGRMRDSRGEMLLCAVVVVNDRHYADSDDGEEAIDAWSM
jgi:hypothetical protein